MSGSKPQSRRSFLGRVAAVGAGAALSTQVLGQPGAVASSAPPTPGLAGGTPGAPAAPVGPAGVPPYALTAGYKVATTARLDVLEAHARITPPPQRGAFRAWALERVSRIEELRDIRPAGQGGDPWRDWLADRITTVEYFLPAPLRFPFYTHLPLDTTAAAYGPLLRERIREGSCNGIFLYENSWTPLAPDGYLDSITSSGPPVPILMSPKNVSDPVTLKAWMDYWAARPAWLPYVRVAFWQEFQDDFGEPGQRAISDWHDGVTTLADAADKVGIVSVAHGGTWNLHPSQPQGGIPRLLEFLQPVIHRLGGGVSWSVFVFAQRAMEANNYVTWMNDFMVAYFPYSPYGVSSYGDSIPPSTPLDDPRRVLRAERVASMFTDLNASRARYGGYYALPAPENPLWSFWDDLVRDECTDALDDLSDAERHGQLRVRDDLALGRAA